MADLDAVARLGHGLRMILLPGLTTTRKERIPAFIDALRESDVTTIAFFPTLLDRSEREALYRSLESIDGLRIPHVHARSDFADDEFAYLAGQFDAQAFNIHPKASTHPFPTVPGAFAQQVFVENVVVPPEDAELDEFGGICPDYAHLESARYFSMADYVERVERQLGRYRIGCCHISAFRVGDPNSYNGAWDHHEFRTLADFDYLAQYRDALPDRWASLELENSLEEQLQAIDYIGKMFGAARKAGASR